MPPSEAFAAPPSVAVPAARAHARAVPAPLPRTVGLTIAVGISLLMWGALIEGGIGAWSLLHRI